jgi:type I restriction-modification system DNA methylase subunit
MEQSQLDWIADSIRGIADDVLRDLYSRSEHRDVILPMTVVRMAHLIFLPVAKQIESGPYMLYDGACGTAGMLTVAEETLPDLAHRHKKQVATLLHGIIGGRPR